MKKIFTTIFLFLLTINLYATNTPKKTTQDFMKQCNKDNLEDCDTMGKFVPFDKKSTNNFLETKDYQSKNLQKKTSKNK